MTLTLQDVAGGRFMLGVGSGWLEEEFAALGVPFDERRSRYEEALAVLRAAWAGGEIAFAGEHVEFEHVVVPPSRFPGSLLSFSDQCFALINYRNAGLTYNWSEGASVCRFNS